MNISIAQIILLFVFYLILFGDLKTIKHKINKLYKVLKKKN
jgi:hypothetical protein